MDYKFGVEQNEGDEDIQKEKVIISGERCESLFIAGL